MDADSLAHLLTRQDIGAKQRFDGINSKASGGGGGERALLSAAR